MIARWYDEKILDEISIRLPLFSIKREMITLKVVCEAICEAILMEKKQMGRNFKRSFYLTIVRLLDARNSKDHSVLI